MSQKSTKGCLKPILIVLAALLVLPILSQLYVKFKIEQIRRADPARILDACREMIAKRESFKNNRDKWPSLINEDAVLLLRPIPESVPQSIQQLNPKYIIIRPDSVLVDFNIPFARAAVLAFRSGVQQYGTYQFVDGLWFWNGNKYPSSPTKH